jgi:plastocyanin
MRVVIVLLPAVAFLAGCGGNSNSSSSSVPSGNVMKTVQVSEKEYSLTPSTVTVSKPGTYAFQVTNKGTITHALEIEGNGVEQETADIQAGSNATLNVTFTKNGSYEIYCPIDGHKDKGMKGTLTVGNTAGGGGTTSTEDETTTTTSTTRDY